MQQLTEAYLAFKKETRAKTSQDVLDSLNDQLTKKASDLQAEQDKWAEFQKSNNVAVLEEDGRSAGVYLSQLNLELAKSRLDLNLLNQGIAAATLPVAGSASQASTNAATDLLAFTATNSFPAATPASTTNPAAFTAANFMPVAAPVSTTNQVAESDDAAFNSARLELAVMLGNQEEKMRYMGKQGFEREVARLRKSD